jgi:hypothetical protein
MNRQMRRVSSVFRKRQLFKGKDKDVDDSMTNLLAVEQVPVAQPPVRRSVTNHRRRAKSVLTVEQKAQLKQEKEENIVNRVYREGFYM